MVTLDSKFIEKELIKYVDPGDEFPFLTVGSVDVDDKQLTCVMTFSGTEESFKKQAIVASSEHLHEKFIQTRTGTSYFKDMIDDVRDAANDRVREWGSDELKETLEDMFLDAVYMRCEELHATGDLHLTEELMDDLTVIVVLDRINRVYVTDGDVVAYHDEVKENFKTGELEGWMVDRMNLLPIADNEYDATFRVDVETRGLEIGLHVSFIRPVPVDLNKLSVHEVREHYFGRWTSSEYWNTFTHPDTDPGKVASLADYIAEVASEDYMEDAFYAFSLDEVKEDILAFIRDDLEQNNQVFATDGQGWFGDEIILDEVDKVEITVVHEEHFSIIDADNLLEWRNEYVASGEAADWEDWVIEDGE